MIINQKGFSIVELLIAMLISLVLLGGAFAMLQNSNNISIEVEEYSKLQEALRIANDALAFDIRMAGFTGCTKEVVVNNRVHPTKINNSYGLISTDANRALEGYDPSVSRWKPSNRQDYIGFMYQRTVNDAISMRYVEGDRSSPTTVDAGLSGNLTIGPSSSPKYPSRGVLAITDCNTTDIFVSSSVSAAGTITHLASTQGNTDINLSKAYLTGSFISRAIFRRYFIRVWNGEPTLVVNYMDGPTRRIDPYAIGIERLVIRYGVDTAGDDGKPDSYVKAKDVVDWNSVVSVKYALMARSQRPSGLDMPNEFDMLDETVVVPEDGRLRKVLTNTVLIRNRTLS